MLIFKLKQTKPLCLKFFADKMDNRNTFKYTKFQSGDMLIK